MNSPVILSDADKRVILFALKNCDFSVNEGMSYWTRTLEFKYLKQKLSEALPENQELTNSN
jgi:hypothetical protein